MQLPSHFSNPTNALYTGQNRELHSPPSLPTTYIASHPIYRHAKYTVLHERTGVSADPGATAQ